MGAPGIEQEPRKRVVAVARITPVDVDAYWRDQLGAQSPGVIAHPEDTMSARMARVDEYWRERLGS